ncbi:MAG: redox-regulated ATPase YchF [Chloroflexi bacterium]|nr:redox-regulated ATPase YchF [Chloroflexota bacterium]
MTLSLGLVGLPNSGKSTLFNALTRLRVPVASYPFTTIEPHVGVVPVPDQRLQHIAEIVRPQRVVPTVIEFVDIAGLVRGSSKGEGLGNQFLSHIRNVNAVAVVVRCFSDADVPHIYNTIDPVRDAKVISTELCLADLAMLERRMERIHRAAKSGDKQFIKALDLLGQFQIYLDAGRSLRSFPFDVRSAELAQSLDLTVGLLTTKPILYVANVDEERFAAAVNGPYEALPDIQALKELSEREGVPMVVVSAKIEAELNELPEDEAKDYLAAMGVYQSGLQRLVEVSYKLLGLVTFFTTTGGKEVHAWTVAAGMKAPQAAGQVHSDMERGFIRAEVVSYRDLAQAGSFAAAREHALIRLEGHNYIVQDGDIIHFRFSV